MSDNVFLKLVTGNRMSSLMGLELETGLPPKYAHDYCYVEVPLKEIYNPADEKVVTKALRNQHLKLIPACKLNVRGRYRVMVKTNPKLQEVASCPAMFMLDIDTKEQASFYATFRKDMDIGDIEWAVRLYLLS